VNLIDYGFDDKVRNEFEKIKDKEYLPARVVRQEKGCYHVQCEYGEVTSEVSGKFRYNTKSKSDFPAVGDWAAIKLTNECKSAIIYSVLPRKSSLTRKAPISGGRTVRNINGKKMAFGGTTEEQVIAANIDILFFVMSLDNDYSLKRMERYLTVGWNSGATPVILLNKIDLCTDLNEKLSEIEKISVGVNVHCISAMKNEGIEELSQYISNGKTIGLFGSSGVGKSTISNCLLRSDELATGEVREKDSKGRHTTTWRELILLPEGGVIIDTPGMREFQVWLDQDELDTKFEDIKEIENQCKYNDCSHKKEPGCSIRKALQEGTLRKERYENYLMMKIEVGYLNHRINQRDKALTKREVLVAKIRSNH
jgi:ribosome biogenesis GTPase / thiamine phosphate phosphatase